MGQIRQETKQQADRHFLAPQSPPAAEASVVAVQDAPGSRGALLKYLALQLQDYVGQRVLHLNAGAGGLARALMPRRVYVACAPSATGAKLLQGQLGQAKGLSTAAVRAPFAEHMPRHSEGYDTILWTKQAACSQLDGLALRHLRTALAPHGRILLLVAGAKEPFVAMDKVAEKAGLQLRQLRQFDRLGTPLAQAERLLSRVGLGAPVQALGDALRPLASRWDDRWPFAGRYALAVLVHAPQLAEAEWSPDLLQPMRLRSKQPAD